ncbi:MULTISPECIES: YbaB/EbfC family nucleoid-associated protein [Actinosynnema]|uniref:YbaB/EbfC family nucleoid-associated protein n=1 Tax=Actinosynnema TaxID=40566 RepID=UPI0020A45ABE|nr:YbaB/EbfC family nucleoid-associated protein [Actinosynnema pretiosum]MCP2092351.1 YbaB/EbfC DNA-binding family protein [Actinosynnema pretiosum]
MTDWAEHLTARIEAIDLAARGTKARAENYRRMAEELAEVTGTAASDGGVVTVVAEPGGAVRSVVFGAAVATTAPAELSALVTRTIARAQADAHRAQAEVVRRSLGDTELLDRVLAEDAALFGDLPPRDPGPAAPVTAPAPGRAGAPSPQPPRRPAPGPDDDLGERSVLGQASW